MGLKLGGELVCSLINAIPLDRLDGYNDRLLHLIAGDTPDLLLAVLLALPLIIMISISAGRSSGSCFGSHTVLIHPHHLPVRLGQDPASPRSQPARRYSTR